MAEVVKAEIISSAWTETLRQFVGNTHRELLLMSPWITGPAARLISRSVPRDHPLTLQILARLDMSDFLSGSSHVTAFQRTTYPELATVAVRALPMLHAKVFISDRQRVILGSANLTDGGLYRNHEMSLLIDSPDLGEELAQAYFRLWSLATPIEESYLQGVEDEIEASMPDTDDEAPVRRAQASLWSRASGIKVHPFKYTKPSGAKNSQRQMLDLLSSEPPPQEKAEDTNAALDWLVRTKAFLIPEEAKDPLKVRRLERLMYHPDIGVRATAIDRAGRSGVLSHLPRLQLIATNPSEPECVRSAAVFSLGLIGAPEALPVLSSLVSEGGDVGRWSRRGCFLLLDSVDAESQSYLLRTLNVQDCIAVQRLARRCDVASGTVSERMTKALILDKCAMAEWSEPDIFSLACIITLVCRTLEQSHWQLPNLRMVVKFVAEPLHIAPGDLRHGPLSPSFLRRTISDGLVDSGLKTLMGAAWEKASEISDLTAMFSSKPGWDSVSALFAGRKFGKIRAANVTKGS